MSQAQNGQNQREGYTNQSAYLNQNEPNSKAKRVMIQDNIYPNQNGIALPSSNISSRKDSITSSQILGKSAGKGILKFPRSAQSPTSETHSLNLAKPPSEQKPENNVSSFELYPKAEKSTMSPQKPNNPQSSYLSGSKTQAMPYEGNSTSAMTQKENNPQMQGANILQPLQQTRKNSQVSSQLVDPPSFKNSNQNPLSYQQQSSQQQQPHQQNLMVAKAKQIQQINNVSSHFNQNKQPQPSTIPSNDKPMQMNNIQAGILSKQIQATISQSNDRQVLDHNKNQTSVNASADPYQKMDAANPQQNQLRRQPLPNNQPEIQNTQKGTTDEPNKNISLMRRNLLEKMAVNRMRPSVDESNGGGITGAQSNLGKRVIGYQPGLSSIQGPLLSVNDRIPIVPDKISVNPGNDNKNGNPLVNNYNTIVSNPNGNQDENNRNAKQMNEEERKFEKFHHSTQHLRNKQANPSDKPIDLNTLSQDNAQRNDNLQPHQYAPYLGGEVQKSGGLPTTMNNQSNQEPYQSRPIGNNYQNVGIINGGMEGSQQNVPPKATNFDNNQNPVRNGNGQQMTPFLNQNGQPMQQNPARNANGQQQQMTPILNQNGQPMQQMAPILNQNGQPMQQNPVRNGNGQQQQQMTPILNNQNGQPMQQMAPILNQNGQPMQQNPVRNGNGQQQQQMTTILNQNGQPMQQNPVRNGNGQQQQMSPFLNQNGQQMQQNPVRYENGQQRQMSPIRNQNGQQIQQNPVRNEYGQQQQMVPIMNQNGQPMQQNPVRNENGQQQQMSPILNQNGQQMQMNPVRYENGQQREMSPIRNQNEQEMQLNPMRYENGKQRQISPFRNLNGQEMQQNPGRNENGQRQQMSPILNLNGQQIHQNPARYENGQQQNMNPIRNQNVQMQQNPVLNENGLQMQQNAALPDYSQQRQQMAPMRPDNSQSVYQSPIRLENGIQRQQMPTHLENGQQMQQMPMHPDNGYQMQQSPMRSENIQQRQQSPLWNDNGQQVMGQNVQNPKQNQQYNALTPPKKSKVGQPFHQSPGQTIHQDSTIIPQSIPNQGTNKKKPYWKPVSPSYNSVELASPQINNPPHRRYLKTISPLVENSKQKMQGQPQIARHRSQHQQIVPKPSRSEENRSYLFDKLCFLSGNKPMSPLQESLDDDDYLDPQDISLDEADQKKKILLDKLRKKSFPSPFLIDELMDKKGRENQMPKQDKVSIGRPYWNPLKSIPRKNNLPPVSQRVVTDPFAFSHQLYHRANEKRLNNQEGIIGLLEEQDRMMNNIITKYKSRAEQEENHLEAKLKELENDRNQLVQLKEQEQQLGLLQFNLGTKLEQYKQNMKFHNQSLSPMMPSLMPALYNTASQMQDTSFLDTILTFNQQNRQAGNANSMDSQSDSTKMRSKSLFNNKYY